MCADGKKPTERKIMILERGRIERVMFFSLVSWVKVEEVTLEWNMDNVPLLTGRKAELMCTFMGCI